VQHKGVGPADFKEQPQNSPDLQAGDECGLPRFPYQSERSALLQGGWTDGVAERRWHPVRQGCMTWFLTLATTLDK
jgi:hypothetical protein